MLVHGVLKSIRKYIHFFTFSIMSSFCQCIQLLISSPWLLAKQDVVSVSECMRA